MYIHTHGGFGGLAAPGLADAPKPSAADALALSHATKLAGVMHTAVQQLGQSVGFLQTHAQQELLREIVDILGAFFPSGFGVMNKDGKVIKTSTRYRKEVIAQHPPRDVPFYFHHDTWLFVSFQKSGVAGRQRPFEPGHRAWIYLCAANLSANVASLADVLVHEMMHMLGHQYRSIEAKFGARVAGETPTPAAGALLNRSTLDPFRRVMEQHFLKLVDFLNRQPHRAAGGSMAQLPMEVVTNWGAGVVEEALAFVFTERATWALAQFQAGKSKIGISGQLVPLQFLKTYFRNYWLDEPKDRAALKTKEAARVFGTMGPDLEKLVDAVRKRIGP